METKRSDSAAESRTATTNVASVFENFPWTIGSEQRSKGASIVDVIDQLLSVYHPDDGLIAYERVLKTLLVLSENLDSELRQQIVSVIPLPKGVPNDKIERLIYKITEPRGSSDVSSSRGAEVVTRSEDKRDTTEEIQQDVSIGSDRSLRSELNEKFVSSSAAAAAAAPPEVFKGFPPNEITSTVHSRVRNVNYIYDTLNYNVVPCVKTCVDVEQNFHEQEGCSLKLKWFHGPPRHLLCETNLYRSTSAASCPRGFVESMDDKYFQLSVDRFDNWNRYNVPHALLHQDATRLMKLYKNNVVSGKQSKHETTTTTTTTTKLETTRDAETSRKNETDCEILYTGDTSRCTSRKCNNATKHRRILDVEAQEFFQQELQSQQRRAVVQRDIYKMDVVQREEDVTDTQTSREDEDDSSSMDDFVPCKRLKASLQHFLSRAKQEILIARPTLPRTKVLHTAAATTPATTKGRTFTGSQRRGDTTRNNDGACVFKDVTDSTEGTKKSTEKKTASLRNVYSKPERLRMLRKNLNTVLNVKSQTIEHGKMDNAENLPPPQPPPQPPPYEYRRRRQSLLSTVDETKQTNALHRTAASITELATFKKQYYDTLLNVQKAKMAVANSLAAMSSVESFTEYEPYHHSGRSYGQRSGQSLEHGPPRFAVHTMAHSGSSSVHNAAPYTWVRYNGLRHPTMKHN